MRNTIFSFLLIFIGLSSVRAQSITGKVIDQQGNAIEFANVVLLSKADSTALAGTITDSTGAFSLQTTVALANTCLRISFVGYKPQSICEMRSDMGRITLENASQNIDEVLVTARKKLYRIEPNGMSARVEGSPLAQLDNATQVLDQIPFVRATDDKLEVFGKGEPLVYINNRLVHNHMEINRLQAADIESVRLITSPGPEYGAGVRAVIRITTKRRKGDGLSGYAFVKGRHSGEALHHNGQGELNYRREKFDVFGSGGWNHHSRHSDENFKLNQANNMATVNMVDDMRFQSYWAETGLNYLPSEQHSLGTRYNFSNDPLSTFDSEFECDLSGTIVDTARYTMTTSNTINDPHHRVNAYYNGQLGERFGIEFNADYLNTASGKRMSNIDRKTQAEVSSLSRSQAQLYSGNLKGSMKALGGEFALGAEAALSRHKQQYSIENAPIDNSTNQSDNTLMAAYASYEATFNEMIQLQAGLRYEHNKFRYLLNGAAAPDKDMDYNLFTPTASVGVALQWLQVGLSYGLKVNKPSYSELRNDVQYNTPFLYEGGNPYLKPTTTNALGLQLGLGFIQLMMGYDMHRNYMMNVLKPYDKNPDVAFFQPQNIDRAQTLSLMASTYLPIGPWEAEIEGGMQKQYLTYQPTGETFNKPLWMVSMRNTIELPWNMVLRLNMQYMGNGHSNTALTKSNFSIDAWVSKYFLNKQLRLNVGVDDITKSSRESWLIDMGGMHLSKNTTHDSRRVQVSLYYTFNRASSRYNGNDSSEEINRL